MALSNPAEHRTFSARVGDDYVPLDAAPLKPDCWGVYFWTGAGDITREQAPNIVGTPVILHWALLEERPGIYNFDEKLGDVLKKAQTENHYAFLMIWVSSPARTPPDYLFTEADVPRVFTRRGQTPLGRKEGTLTYAYYLNENYKKRFYALIDAFAEYVFSLPDELFNRIIFIQVAEGSTGDGQPYKGKPVKDHEKYTISRKQWSTFRIAAWERYKKNFADRGDRSIPLVVNADANQAQEEDWLMKNLPFIGVKQGMFTHGWHISEGKKRRDRWFEFVKSSELAGKHTFVRGEEDGEMFKYGRMTLNIPRGLYTSALHCLYNGVDMWNVPREACIQDENQPAFIFFNKYAGRRNPRSAPGAFCALRQGLDASDKVMFPEGQFGKASRQNISRYLKIADAFKNEGAIQGDPDKAIKGGMVNRKRMNYNDVGWGINTGNYWRFLKQIDPDKTSRGTWHQGPEDSIYSQFGRSFLITGGEDGLWFKLDPWFYEKPVQATSVRIRVVYLDSGKGSWSLHYRLAKGFKKAYGITNKASRTWIEKIIEVNDFSPGLHDSTEADFKIQYDGNGNTIFHMIEIDRL